MGNSNPIYIITLICGMALVTYLPRMLPISILSKTKLPAPLLRWLGLVPVSVLSALLFSELLVVDHKLTLPPENWYPIAALPAFLVAVVTRRLFLTVVVGIGALVIIRYTFA